MPAWWPRSRTACRRAGGSWPGAVAPPRSWPRPPMTAGLRRGWWPSLLERLMPPRPGPWPGVRGRGRRRPWPVLTPDPSPLTPGMTLLCVPLVVGDRALGVLGIDSARFSARRPPRPQDLDLIQAFASQAAVAIENARLMEAAVRRSRRERLLNEILDAVREPIGVAEILSRAVERLGAALEVSRCVALLPQENGEYREHLWTEPRFALPSDAILWE